ncbi:MAG: hypothetical protein KCHDKBKB_00085 [Elusimicrobia bacterium]|nr:hypothetical protein [Elusimicrobiota bacterium]
MDPMNSQVFRRFFSAFLTTLYFTTQVVLGSATESNFWAERKKTSLPKNSLLAALPASRATPVLHQLPSLAPTTISTLEGAAEGSGLDATRPDPSAPWIDSIPLTHGSLQEVYESSDEENQPPVVIVQDIHMNPEAQTNIAGILQELINHKKVGAVGVEGAFDVFDFQPFRRFEDKQTVKTVTEAFLKKNLLAAASYVGVTSPTEPPLFIGMDDHAYYDANVRAYLDSRSIKEKAVSEVRARQQAQQDKKKKVFSTELLRFDQLRSAHAKGTVGLGEYVKNLCPSPSFHNGGEVAKVTRNSNTSAGGDSPGRGFPFVLDQFLSAYEIESTLNFKQAERERQSVIEQLTKTLNEQEMSELMSQSLSYRMGRLGFGAYYQGLKKLCLKKGLSLSPTPAFDEYIRYVLLADGIQAKELYEALEKLESRVLRSLVKTREEQELVDESERTVLQSKLLEFSLTPKEWEKYNRIGRGVNSVPLQPFEDFYRYADLRSDKMVQNLLARIQIAPSETLAVKSEILNSNEVSNPKLLNQQRKGLGFGATDLGFPKPQVLITGGFHTPRITALLRQKKISYAVISPKITHLRQDSGGQAEYLSVFAREKTPLDKLFQGEKLFLSPSKIQTTDPSTAVTLQGSLCANVLGVLTFPWKIGKRFFTFHVRILNKADPTQVEVELSKWDWFYLTLLVNWENALFFLVPATRYLLNTLLPESSPVTWWIVSGVYLLSAALFAAAHPNPEKKTWLRWAKWIVLFGMGLCIGAPFASTSLGFLNAVLISISIHTPFNPLLLRARSLFADVPYLGDFLRWVPLASTLSPTRRRRPRRPSISLPALPNQYPLNAHTLSVGLMNTYLLKLYLKKFHAVGAEYSQSARYAFLAFAELLVREDPTGQTFRDVWLPNFEGESDLQTLFLVGKILSEHAPEVFKAEWIPAFNKYPDQWQGDLHNFLLRYTEDRDDYKQVRRLVDEDPSGNSALAHFQNTRDNDSHSMKILSGYTNVLNQSREALKSFISSDEPFVPLGKALYDPVALWPILKNFSDQMGSAQFAQSAVALGCLVLSEGEPSRLENSTRAWETLIDILATLKKFNIRHEGQRYLLVSAVTALGRQSDPIDAEVMSIAVRNYFNLKSGERVARGNKSPKTQIAHVLLDAALNQNELPSDFAAMWKEFVDTKNHNTVLPFVETLIHDANWRLVKELNPGFHAPAETRTLVRLIETFVSWSNGVEPKKSGAYWVQAHRVMACILRDQNSWNELGLNQEVKDHYYPRQFLREAQIKIYQLAARTYGRYAGFQAPLDEFMIGDLLEDETHKLPIEERVEAFRNKAKKIVDEIRSRLSAEERGQLQPLVDLMVQFHEMFDNQGRLDKVKILKIQADRLENIIGTAVGKILRLEKSVSLESVQELDEQEFRVIRYLMKYPQFMEHSHPLSAPLRAYYLVRFGGKTKEEATSKFYEALNLPAQTPHDKKVLEGPQPLTGHVFTGKLSPEQRERLGQWSEGLRHLSFIIGELKQGENPDKELAKLLEDIKANRQPTAADYATYRSAIKERISEREASATGTIQENLRIAEGHFRRFDELNAQVEADADTEEVMRNVRSVEVEISIENDPIQKLHLGWPSLGGSCLDLIDGSNGKYAAAHTIHPLVRVVFIREKGAEPGKSPLARISVAYDPVSGVLFAISPIKTNSEFEFSPLVGEFMAQWSKLGVDVVLPKSLSYDESLENGFIEGIDNVALAKGPIDFYSDLTGFETGTFRKNLEGMVLRRPSERKPGLEHADEAAATYTGENMTDIQHDSFRLTMAEADQQSINWTIDELVQNALNANMATGMSFEEALRSVKIQPRLSFDKSTLAIEISNEIPFDEKEFSKRLPSVLITLLRMRERSGDMIGLLTDLFVDPRRGREALAETILRVEQAINKTSAGWALTPGEIFLLLRSPFFSTKSENQEQLYGISADNIPMLGISGGAGLGLAKGAELLKQMGLRLAARFDGKRTTFVILILTEGRVELAQVSQGTLNRHLAEIAQENYWTAKNAATGNQLSGYTFPFPQNLRPPDPGGLMEWVREVFYPDMSPSDYAADAYWLENWVLYKWLGPTVGLFVFGLAYHLGLPDIGLGAVQAGDLLSSFKAANAVLWGIFALGHVPHLVVWFVQPLMNLVGRPKRTRGDRAPPLTLPSLVNHFIPALLISTLNITLLTLPWLTWFPVLATPLTTPLFYGALVVVGFVLVHKYVNYFLSVGAEPTSTFSYAQGIHLLKKIQSEQPLEMDDIFPNGNPDVRAISLVTHLIKQKGLISAKKRNEIFQLILRKAEGSIEIGAMKNSDSVPSVLPALYDLGVAVLDLEMEQARQSQISADPDITIPVWGIRRRDHLEWYGIAYRNNRLFFICAEQHHSWPAVYFQNLFILMMKRNPQRYQLLYEPGLGEVDAVRTEELWESQIPYYFEAVRQNVPTERGYATLHHEVVEEAAALRSNDSHPKGIDDETLAVAFLYSYLSNKSWWNNEVEKPVTANHLAYLCTLYALVAEFRLPPGRLDEALLNAFKRWEDLTPNDLLEHVNEISNLFLTISNKKQWKNFEKLNSDAPDRTTLYIAGFAHAGIFQGGFRLFNDGSLNGIKDLSSCVQFSKKYPDRSRFKIAYELAQELPSDIDYQNPMYSTPYERVKGTLEKWLKLHRVFLASLAKHEKEEFNLASDNPDASSVDATAQRVKSIYPASIWIRWTVVASAVETILYQYLGVRLLPGLLLWLAPQMSPEFAAIVGVGWTTLAFVLLHGKQTGKHFAVRLGLSVVLSSFFGIADLRLAFLAAIVTHAVYNAMALALRQYKPTQEFAETWLPLASTITKPQDEPNGQPSETQKAYMDEIVKDVWGQDPTEFEATYGKDDDGHDFIFLKHDEIDEVHNERYSFIYLVRFIPESTVALSPRIPNYKQTNTLIMPTRPSNGWSEQVLENGRNAFRRAIVGDPKNPRFREKVVLARYQAEAVKKTLAALEEHKLGMNVMATATGKTVVALMTMHLYRKERLKTHPNEDPGAFLFVVNRGKILEQAEDLLVRLFPGQYRTTRIYGGVINGTGDYAQADVIFATPASLVPRKKGEKDDENQEDEQGQADQAYQEYEVNQEEGPAGADYRLAKLLRSRKIGGVIFDEVHHAPASTFDRVWDEVITASQNNGWDTVILGYTATEVRPDKLPVVGRFQPAGIVHEYSIKKARDEGYVVPPVVVSGDTDIRKKFNMTDTGRPILPGEPSYEDYKAYLYSPERYPHLLQQYRQHSNSQSDKRALIIAPSVEDAQNLRNYFLKNGVKAICLTSKEDKTYVDHHYQAWKDRAWPKESHYGSEPFPDVVVSVSMFREGVDIPGIRLVILWLDPNSIISFMQIFGRGLRLAKFKSHMLFVDTVGAFRKVHLLRYLAGILQSERGKNYPPVDLPEMGELPEGLGIPLFHEEIEPFSPELNQDVTEVFDLIFDDTPGMLWDRYGTQVPPSEMRDHMDPYLARHMMNPSSDQNQSETVEQMKNYLTSIAGDLSKLNPETINELRSRVRSSFFPISSAERDTGGRSFPVSGVTENIFMRLNQLIRSASPSIQDEQVELIFPEFSALARKKSENRSRNLAQFQTYFFRNTLKGFVTFILESKYRQSIKKLTYQSRTLLALMHLDTGISIPSLLESNEEISPSKLQIIDDAAEEKGISSEIAHMGLAVLQKACIELYLGLVLPVLKKSPSHKKTNEISSESFELDPLEFKKKMLLMAPKESRGAYTPGKLLIDRIRNFSTAIKRNNEKGIEESATSLDQFILDLDDFEQYNIENLNRDIIQQLLNTRLTIKNMLDSREKNATGIERKLITDMDNFLRGHAILWGADGPASTSGVLSFQRRDQRNFTWYFKDDSGYTTEAPFSICRDSSGRVNVYCSQFPSGLVARFNQGSADDRNILLKAQRESFVHLEKLFGPRLVFLFPDFDSTFVNALMDHVEQQTTLNFIGPLANVVPNFGPDYLRFRAETLRFRVEFLNSGELKQMEDRYFTRHENPSSWINSFVLDREVASRKGGFTTPGSIARQKLNQFNPTDEEGERMLNDLQSEGLDILSRPEVYGPEFKKLSGLLQLHLPNRPLSVIQVRSAHGFLGLMTKYPQATDYRESGLSAILGFLGAQVDYEGQGKSVPEEIVSDIEQLLQLQKKYLNPSFSSALQSEAIAIKNLAQQITGKLKTSGISSVSTAEGPPYFVDGNLYGWVITAKKGKETLHLDPFHARTALGKAGKGAQIIPTAVKNVDVKGTTYCKQCGKNSNDHGKFQYDFSKKYRGTPHELRRDADGEIILPSSLSENRTDTQDETGETNPLSRRSVGRAWGGATLTAAALGLAAHVIQMNDTASTILIVSALTLFGFFTLLLALMPFIWTAGRFLGNVDNTGPPEQIFLYGRDAVFSDAAHFIEYNPNKSRFEVNPRLYRLLTFGMTSPSKSIRTFGVPIRYVTHFVLALVFVPLHEGRHARGDTTEWRPFLLQFGMFALVIASCFVLPALGFSAGWGMGIYLAGAAAFAGRATSKPYGVVTTTDLFKIRDQIDHAAWQGNTNEIKRLISSLETLKSDDPSASGLLVEIRTDGLTKLIELLFYESSKKMNGGQLDSALECLSEAQQILKSHSGIFQNHPLRQKLSQLQDKIRNLRAPINAINAESLLAYLPDSVTQVSLENQISDGELTAVLLKTVGWTDRNRYWVVSLVNNSDGTFSLAARANVDIDKDKTSSKPFTVTFIKGKGFLQRTITLLLRKNVLSAWQSDDIGQRSDEANEMYRRMESDATLKVTRNQRTIVVTLSGVEWISDVLTAFLEKDISRLAPVAPINVGGEITSSSNHEAALIDQIEQLANNPDLLQAIRTRISEKTHAQISDEALEVLIAVALGKSVRTGTAQTILDSTNTGDNCLMVFKGKSASDSERRVRKIRMMAAFVRMASTKIDLMADEEARPEVQQAIAALQSFGLTVQSRILWDQKKFSEMAQNATLVIVPPDMKIDLGLKKFISFDEFIPPITNAGIDRLDKALRAILSAA